MSEDRPAYPVGKDKNMEYEITRLTKRLLKECHGQNSAVVVGAGLNMIQTCMTYVDATFQRACAEMLRGMANTQLQVIGKPKQ